MILLGEVILVSGAELNQKPIDEEDQLRASAYGLLATVLARPPDSDTLQKLSQLQGDASALGKAFSRLGENARTMEVSDIFDEYQALFIGLGRGEILPFGSYYLTGFLHEKPLARLRKSMAELGIERDPSVKEPEDHIAALMDTMAGLISGRFGPPASLQVQKGFFDMHIASWASYMFADLEKAKNAHFYKPVGAIGRLFLEIERAAFEMI